MGIVKKDLLKYLVKTYKIPLIEAKKITAKSNSYIEAEKYLADTKENWCSNILDYKDSQELKELRKNYN